MYWMEYIESRENKKPACVLAILDVLQYIYRYFYTRHGNIDRQR